MLRAVVALAPPFSCTVEAVVLAFINLLSDRVYCPVKLFTLEDATKFAKNALSKFKIVIGLDGKIESFEIIQDENGLDPHVDN